MKLKFAVVKFSLIVCLLSWTVLWAAGPLKAPSSLKSDSYRIAVGSCNRESLDQSYWDTILTTRPHQWVWLGDNIYGDSFDPNVLKRKWNLMSENPYYKNFKSQVPVTGTWDDHDFGFNDAGREFPIKKTSQQLFFDFFEIPQESPLRKQEGIYRSHLFEFKKFKIKLIILDSRYHRTALKRKLLGGYVPAEGDFLGEIQWTWLENEIRSTQDVDALIIANGITVISDQHAYEKWGNFPKQREKLLELAVQSQAKLKIFLSGDRHFGEISKLHRKSGETLYELQSSGLTHSWESVKEKSSYRIGELWAQRHFGQLEFFENAEGNLEVELQLLSLPQGEIVRRFRVPSI